MAFEIDLIKENDRINYLRKLCGEAAVLLEEAKKYMHVDNDILVRLHFNGDDRVDYVPHFAPPEETMAINAHANQLQYLQCTNCGRPAEYRGPLGFEVTLCNLCFLDYLKNKGV
jgi:hypothetical protein